MTNRKSVSAEYWERNLLSWEAGAYFKDGTGSASWWDRLSAVFRGDAMYVRMAAALELARPVLKGASVLDVGCASGRFAFRLLDNGAARVHGVDISADAVERASRRSAELGLQEQMRWSVADVVQVGTVLPEVDLVTALGVIEYFDASAMATFLSNLRTKYLLLDFPDIAKRKEFPTWQLRQIYIRKNRLPGLYLYTLEEFSAIAGPLGFQDLQVVERDRFYFVSNFRQS